MKKSISSLLVLLGGLAVAALLFGSGGAAAQNEEDARIAGLALKADGGQLVVGFQLVGGFDAELQKRVDSGLPTQLAIAAFADVG